MRLNNALKMQHNVKILTAEKKKEKKGEPQKKISAFLCDPDSYRDSATSAVKKHE